MAGDSCQEENTCIYVFFTDKHTLVSGRIYFIDKNVLDCKMTCRKVINMTEKEYYAWLGNKLKKLREQKGFTRREIQEKIGMHPNFLANIENYGEKISVYQLDKLLNSLGFTQADLFEDAEKKTSLSHSPPSI